MVDCGLCRGKRQRRHDHWEPCDICSSSQPLLGPIDVVEAPFAHSEHVAIVLRKVASYTQLATEALAEIYSGPPDAEVAK